MSNELDESYKLADGEATLLLKSPAPIGGGESGYKLLVMFAKALVLLAREARRLSLFKVLYDQMALAATCDCKAFVDCQHLADAFSVYEATRSEMERIALARTQPPAKKKPDIMAPGIESVVNPETIH